MPGSTVLTLSGTVTGLPTGQQTVNVPWNLPNAVGQMEPVTLGVGDTHIVVPTGAATVLIVPPDNNAVVIRMKDIQADVGIQLHPGVPCFRSLAAIASFWLTIASPLTGPCFIAFW